MVSDIWPVDHRYESAGLLTLSSKVTPGQSAVLEVIISFSKASHISTQASVKLLQPSLLPDSTMFEFNPLHR